MLLQWAAAAGVLALSGLAAPALGQTRPKTNEVEGMPTLKSPMINLYARDLARATSFRTDDTDAAASALTARGAPALAGP